MEEVKLSKEEIERQAKRPEELLKRDRYRRIATLILVFEVVLLVMYLIVSIAPFLNSEAELAVFLLYRVLPVVIIIAVIIIARKWELIGGLIIIALGAACLAFVFNMHGLDPGGLGTLFAYFIFILFCTPLVIAGILFILSWRIDNRLNEQ